MVRSKYLFEFAEANRGHYVNDTSHPTPIMKSPARTLLAAATLVAASSSLAAGTDTWLGNTATTWSTAANWTGANTPPASGDDLVFGGAGTSGLTLTDDLTSLGINSLTFNSGAGAFVIGGNAFSLAGNITNSSTALESLGNAITLTGATTVTTTAGGGYVALSGVLSGAGSIAESGTGTLTLSGANTYTGGLTVNSGTLVAATANGSSYGAAGNGNIVVNNGGTISVTGDNALWGSGQGTTTKSLQINAGGVVTIGTNTAHLSALVMNGGTLNATGTNYWGSWDLDGRGLHPRQRSHLLHHRRQCLGLPDRWHALQHRLRRHPERLLPRGLHRCSGDRPHQGRIGHTEAQQHRQLRHGQRDGECRNTSSRPATPTIQRGRSARRT